MANIPNVYQWHVLDDLRGSWDKAKNYAIAHDSQGYVYVAGCAVREMDVTLRFLQRFTPDGTPVPAEHGGLPWYSGVTDYTEWTELAAQRMLVDEANHRLYILVRGSRYFFPGLPRYFLYAHDLTTGDRIWSQYVGWSYDENSHLDVDGAGNIWVAITDGSTNGFIKLSKFSYDGTASLLPQEGLLPTTKQRDFFAFGARKKDNSLYLAYKEWGAGQPIDDLVIARYDHDLTFLGKSTYELGFEPPPDPNLVHNVHNPEFHDGIVDVHDRFVIGGYFAVERDILHPEGFGMHRIHYPLVFGFDTDGSEFFRYVDTSSSYSLSLSPVSDLDILQYPQRAIVKRGEGADVLYTISTFPCTLCIRDNGTRADLEYLVLDPRNRKETIGSCDYLVALLGLDFTYIPSVAEGPRRVVRAGGSVLIGNGNQCEPVIADRPSVLSFYPAFSWSFQHFFRWKMKTANIYLGQIPVPFRLDPQISILIPPDPVSPKGPLPPPPPGRSDRRRSFSRFSQRHARNDIRILERMVLARISSSEALECPDSRDTLAETLDQLPVTANFTEELREQISRLHLEGKDNTKLQELLPQALNAIVTDSVLAAQPVRVQVYRTGSRVVHRYGELAWLELDGTEEADGSTLEVIAGIEKMPEGTDALWPAVTLRFTNRQHISGRLYIAYRAFRFKGYSSRLRMLAVDDGRMVDITERVDTVGRVISGRVERLKDVVLVHVSPALSPSRFS
jgi:hypothetical protein